MIDQNTAPSRGRGGSARFGGKQKREAEHTNTGLNTTRNTVMGVQSVWHYSVHFTDKSHCWNKTTSLLWQGDLRCSIVLHIWIWKCFFLELKNLSTNTTQFTHSYILDYVQSQCFFKVNFNKLVCDRMQTPVSSMKTTMHPSAIQSLLFTLLQKGHTSFSTSSGT